MNLLDLQVKLNLPIPPIPPITDQQHDHAAAYVQRVLGDDCGDVLGIGGRP